MLVPGSHSWLLMSRTSSPGGSDVTVPLSVLPSVSRPPSFPLSPSTHTRCHPLALAIPPSNPTVPMAISLTTVAMGSATGSISSHPCSPDPWPRKVTRKSGQAWVSGLGETPWG